MSESIKVFIFDVYGTLFDVTSVKRECEKLYSGKGEKISRSWRAKQVEYFLFRQVMGKYATFLDITKDALRYALKENDAEWSGQNEEHLLEAYLRLPAYPEVASVLDQLKDKTLAILSNGSHDMLDPLVQHAGFSGIFDRVLSIDEVKQYKPSSASYGYALDALEVERSEVLFMSSNGWDISGAKNFGFQTAWINRNNLAVEELGLMPDYTFSDLTGLLKWK